MSDAVDRGITVTEIAAMDKPIDASPETTAAFVGRALRGPLNTPVLVHHFGEFRRRFGDSWSRSSLGPAVQQFFDHGGRNLYIVRVANNARGAMLCLQASGSALVLRALEPGSTERLRAAVDYDGIDDDDDECFNLTLQRIEPCSGVVLDQEIFRNLSITPDSSTFAPEILLNSTMVRAEHPWPTHRPDETASSASRYDLTWVGHVQEGTDGTELSDYDLVGSRQHFSGLFALEQIGHFDLLYLPPPGKHSDTGPTAILAGELYCRQRGAMLIVDPASSWSSPEDAIAGVRDLGYASPNMLSYFPRVLRRPSDDEPPRPAGAAIAGLLCKLDRNSGPWRELDSNDMGFSRALRPSVEVDDERAHALERAGINVICPGPAARPRLAGSMTMGRGSESHRVFTSLPVRRLCLRVINSIDLATRWAVFEHPDRAMTDRIRIQILNYLSVLAERGALANDRFVVQCESGASGHEREEEGGVTILLVFQPIACAQPISFTLHQSAAGCSVMSTAFAPVAENCA